MSTKQCYSLPEAKGGSRLPQPLDFCLVTGFYAFVIDDEEGMGGDVAREWRDCYSRHEV